MRIESSFLSIPFLSKRKFERFEIYKVSFFQFRKYNEMILKEYRRLTCALNFIEFGHRLQLGLKLDPKVILK